MIREADRRHFLSLAAVAGSGVALNALPRAAQGGAKGAKAKPADINATEDLMREHGLLNRVLLIYEEGVRRLKAGAPPSAEVFASSATIIQRFVESYHEKLEEEEVFPRLEKAGKLVDLTRVLKEQHAAGRALTAEILKYATPESLKDEQRNQQLMDSIQRFIRMYRPHEAREDTVLFPAFHSLFSEAEFDKLGDRFEKKEQQMLGKAGFEGTLNEVAKLEKTLGIYDLSLFTPRA